jgi:diaminohydroxyphosphoribosylaminopyrimidine deaminase/5-amino-6-(5-phosphoribosylamino)uracil reductase
MSRSTPSTDHSNTLNEHDRHWLGHAWQLAQRGLFTVSPNPCVGCVIVKDGRLLAEGFHQQAGGAHAEVNALQNLSLADSQGATLYVTLEPCCHQGKTPPCTQALIRAKLARVVVAQIDPNPLVAGQGIAQLRAAGICVDVQTAVVQTGIVQTGIVQTGIVQTGIVQTGIVQTGIAQTEAQSLNRGFFQRMRTGLPRVRIKMAASMDGRTALANGESQWLTGAAARQDVQYLRAQSCAIISSAATVLADHARLTVRPDTWPIAYPPVPMAYADQQGHVRQPLRVIVDAKRRLPIDHPIFQQHGRTLWCVAQPFSPSAPNVDVLPVPLLDDEWQADGLDLAFILRELAKRQCNEVLIEAGPRLASSFLAQQWVDEIWLYQAPLILGDQAKPLFYTQLEQLSQAKRWSLHSVDRFDQDVRLIWSRSCLPD